MALFGWLTACAQSAPPPNVAPGIRRAAYVVRRGFHTDIGLPTKYLSSSLRPLASVFPGAETLLVGFGDRTFVQSRGHRWLGDWLLALLPGQGAMLVTGLRVPPDQAFGANAVVALSLTETEWNALQQLVRASFSPPDHLPRRLADGPYAGSRFFASSKTYDLLDTCNSWTAQALRAAGEPMPVALTLFAGQTMADVRHLPAARNDRAAGLW